MAPGLNKNQSKQLEHIQKRAFKIAAPDLNYTFALETFNVKTLYDRREDRCRLFFQDICKPSHRLNHLLPPPCDVSHLRSNRQFQLPRIRTNRLKNSPVYYGVFNFNNI